MHTDEAQKLLFMPDKVNNILISNAGDEVSGMVHTADVSDQLRALSLNEERAAGLLEVLRRPEIARVIRQESVAPVNPLFGTTYLSSSCRSPACGRRRRASSPILTCWLTTSTTLRRALYQLH